MKVFKIQKYHAIYGTSLLYYVYYTLCSREHPINFAELKDYNKDTMDLCKTCQKVIFDRIVRKLKGRGSF